MEKFLLIILLTFSFNGFSQCTSWQTVNFDSYEYTTNCPYIIPGQVVHLSPQLSPAFGPSFTGSRHLYLNFQALGAAFSRPYSVCVGETYRISFYHRDAWGGANNTTFNIYDQNDLLLSTTNVPWTGTAWNNFVSPELTATTTTLRLEIVNNTMVGNNDMVVDDMQLEVCSIVENEQLNVCGGGTVNLFDSFSGSMPLGGTWSGPSTLNNGNLGTFDSNIHQSGVYTYTFPDASPCPTPYGSVEVMSPNQINLGNDTVVCGSGIVLDAGANFDYYNWSTGETTQTINVTSTGTYSVSAGSTGGNLIVNGDFESGATGFSSDYVQGTGGTWGVVSVEGTYDVSTSPSLSHNNFMSCGDHTTGSGNMMVVNGAGTLGLNVWCQTVNVNPNSDYIFSAWISNALNDPAVANLQFFVNGVQIGSSFSTSPNGCTWEQFNDFWNSGMSTTANICIVNQNAGVSGNDFVLDDLYFSEVCINTDEIEVTMETLTVDAGQNITFCPNAPESVTAVSNDANAQFVWNQSSNGATFNPTTAGWQVVEVTSQSGCVVSDSLMVTITPMNWGIDLIESYPTDCGLTNGAVTVQTNGTFDSPPYYTWSGPGPNSANQINATVFTNLASGWYYLTIESNGCFLYDSAFVNSNNLPIASTTPTPATGSSPLDVSFLNNSQNATNYYWDFGNGTQGTTNNLDPQSATYLETGVYTVMLVASQGDCFDTVYTQITVIDQPFVNVPNVITANGDGVNDVFEVKTQSIAEYHLIILNRWGASVFETDDLTNHWDGSLAGEKLSEGTYFYKIEMTDLNGESIKKHGFVQLIRH